MNLSRREFLQMLAAANAAGFGLTACGNEGSGQGAGGAVGTAKGPANPYELPSFGNVSLLHYTDCHAQLLPVYFREPNINLGVGSMRGRPPHLVGKRLLEYFNLEHPTLWSHAYTHLDFTALAEKYGRVGATYAGPVPDDLSTIRGIGRVAKSSLYAAGIYTYRDLATAMPELLARIIPSSPNGDEIDYGRWLKEARRLADRREDA